MLPLSISTLPYNQDGLTECRIATDLQQTRHLRFANDTAYSETHSIATPVYDLMLAFTSSVLGSPALEIAQLVIGAIAILTIVGGYLVAKMIVGRTREAMVGALVLTMLGSFLFVTGSTWKETLGVSMLILLYYAYMKRTDSRMFVLEIVILATIPFVHHLVAVLGYFSISLLTVWSVLFALKNRSMTKRHYLDIWVVTMLGAGSYLYYVFVKLDRLSYVKIEGAWILMILIFLGLAAIMFFWMTMKKHSKITFAQVPALLILGLFLADYFFPLFPYTPGSPITIVIFAAALAVLIFFAWLGIEDLVESNNRYRALPLGMLLPVVTLIAFSLTSGFTLSAHQTMYRSFDFADIGLAMGVAMGVVHFRKRPRLQAGVIAVVLVALAITMPYGYATHELTGVRHDTQSYEVDALSWLNESTPRLTILQSDERLSYVAMALYDFKKMPYLPERLMKEGLLGINAFYAFEDEWITEGVNDYPRGHPNINETRIQLFFECSSVVYIGGPMDNQITIFSPTIMGYDKVLGHH